MIPLVLSRESVEPGPDFVGGTDDVVVNETVHDLKPDGDGRIERLRQERVRGPDLGDQRRQNRHPRLDPVRGIAMTDMGFDFAINRIETVLALAGLFDGLWAEGPVRRQGPP